MNEFALDSGLLLPRIEIPRPKLIVPSFLAPTKAGAEFFRDIFESKEMRVLDKLFKLSTLKERILMMAGSDANFLSKALGDAVFGATAFTAASPLFVHLWTSALDDTFTGATTGKTDYGSYAALSLTNNTTIFAAGTGTTTYAKSFPSDAAKNFATATSPSTNPITYLGVLNANAGTSADKGYIWGSVTSTAIATGDTPQLAQNAITQTRD